MVSLISMSRSIYISHYRTVPLLYRWELFSCNIVPTFELICKRHFCGVYISATVWSSRKTGTKGTLTSQAEIAVWVQAPPGIGMRGLLRSAAWVRGRHPRNYFEIEPINAKSCNLVHFGGKMVSNAVHNAFVNTNNGNGVPALSPRNYRGSDTMTSTHSRNYLPLPQMVFTP